jgi:CelD/BcsL family acetyltransferase involved in cellulose biosynthesis
MTELSTAHLERRRARATSPAEGLSFELVRSDADLHALEWEWAELFARVGTRNPFMHPAWMIPWLRAFVPDVETRFVFAVRKGSDLVAVAPLYEKRYGIGRFSARTLQLAGASPAKEDRLTEMSGVLVAGCERRRIMRALIHTAVDIADWDWLGLTLPGEQGWFETAWIPEAWQRGGANILHKGVRASVVLPLPAAWEDLRFKRNQREALRRSRNRLLSLDQEVEISFAEGVDLPQAVEEAVALHRRRAQLQGHLRHDDYFEPATCSALLHEAAAHWARHGNAAVATLRLDGRPIAARLLLHANRGMFLSFSGAEPELWRLCAPTAIVEASVRRAISDGMNIVNFSTSPDSAKLRWSEQLQFENEFLLVSPSRRSRLVFGAWWQARARRALAKGRRLVAEQAVVD